MTRRELLRLGAAVAVAPSLPVPAALPYSPAAVRAALATLTIHVRGVGILIPLTREANAYYLAGSIAYASRARGWRIVVNDNEPSRSARASKIPVPSRL